MIIYITYQNYHDYYRKNSSIISQAYYRAISNVTARVKLCGKTVWCADDLSALINRKHDKRIWRQQRFAKTTICENCFAYQQLELLRSHNLCPSLYEYNTKTVPQCRNNSNFCGGLRNTHVFWTECVTAVQGHLRSLISVPIASRHATSH